RFSRPISRLVLPAGYSCRQFVNSLHVRGRSCDGFLLHSSARSLGRIAERGRRHFPLACWRRIHELRGDAGAHGTLSSLPVSDRKARGGSRGRLLAGAAPTVRRTPSPTKTADR